MFNAQRTIFNVQYRSAALVNDIELMMNDGQECLEILQIARINFLKSETLNK